MQHTDLQLTPIDVLSRWPANEPVFMLYSGGESQSFARWSVLASPAVTYRFAERSELIVSPGWASHPVVRALERAARDFAHDPLRDLDMLLAVTRRHGEAHGVVPCADGWMGAFGYELGAVIEPTAKRRGTAKRKGEWPLIELGWCPQPFVFDNVKGEWVYGLGGRASGSHERDLRFEISDAPRVEQWRAGSLSPSIPREKHVENVARTIEHIRAGDIFQANITQQFTAPFDGSTRALARTALEASGAWYGAMLELTDGRTIVSMSPELFLGVDASSREVMTRPIKGTRPRASDVRELEHSEKDKAELAMIVDLMRNDFGRVCEIGSIRVTNPRTIETHGAVHQGVGEVTGTLPRHVVPTDLLRAAFPPGSVTGAPKIRAMQIIDELESSPRGPYCGAIGFISDTGDITLNVAIRTIALSGQRPTGRFDALTGTLSYGAGGGIVVDSDPEQEYEEALDKTRLLRERLPR